VPSSDTRFSARAARVTSAGGTPGAKPSVFGLFKRNDRVAAEIAPDAKKTTLRGLTVRRLDLPRPIVSDGEQTENATRWIQGAVILGFPRFFKNMNTFDPLSQMPLE
jgi:hypothetical protein